MGHTEGSWKVGSLTQPAEHGPSPGIIYKHPIWEITTDVPPSRAEVPVAFVRGEVTARLVAAAPDLLKACEALPLDAFPERMGDCDAADFKDHAGAFFAAMRAARAAIALAKGA